MNAYRRLFIIALTLFAYTTPLGAVGPVDTLAVIPENAWAVITLNDLAGIDGKIVSLQKELGFKAVSPLLLAKAEVEIVEGLDESGTTALVVMPPNPQSGMAINLLLIIPTTEEMKLLAYINPRPLEKEPGYTRVTIKNEEAFVGSKNGFSIIGKDLETVKAVVGATKGIGGRVSSMQIDRFKANDITIYADIEALRKSPMFPMISMGLAGLVGPNNLATYKYLQIGAKLDVQGFTLETVYARAGDTDAAETLKTSKSLLCGLAEGDYVLVGGAANGPGDFSVRRSVETLISNPQLSTMYAIDKRGVLMQKLEPVLGGVVRGSFGLCNLPESADGFIGLVKVIEAKEDAREMVQAHRAVMELIKDDFFMDPQIKQMVKMLVYEENAENAEQVSIHHMRLDLKAELEDGEGGSPTKKQQIEWMASLKQLLGSEGILFRMAAVDQRNVLITLGGGREFFDRCMGAVRSGNAAIVAQPGYSQLQPRLSSSRAMEMYLDIDQLFGMIRRIQIAMNQRPLPEFPLAKVPMLISGRQIKPGVNEHIVFLPKENFEPIKAVIMSMTAKALSPGGGLPLEE